MGLRGPPRSGSGRSSTPPRAPDAPYGDVCCIVRALVAAHVPTIAPRTLSGRRSSLSLLLGLVSGSVYGLACFTASPTKCKPHSVFSIPGQRPARASSPGATGLVHGSHPILLYPPPRSGLSGTPRSRTYSSTSPVLQLTSGAIFTTPKRSSQLSPGVLARCAVWSRRIPVTHAP